MDDDVREVAPGVAIMGGTVVLCPACGLKALGGDPDCRLDVVCWLAAVLLCLQRSGVEGASLERAEPMADEWFANGNKAHKEGNHRGFGKRF